MAKCRSPTAKGGVPDRQGSSFWRTPYYDQEGMAAVTSVTRPSSPAFRILHYALFRKMLSLALSLALGPAA